MAVNLKAERGSILIFILLQSAFLSLIVFTMLDTAIVQQKMTSHFQDKVNLWQALKAELAQMVVKMRSDLYIPKEAKPLQFVPEILPYQTVVGVQYYEIHLCKEKGESTASLRAVLGIRKGSFDVQPFSLTFS